MGLISSICFNKSFTEELIFLGYSIFPSIIFFLLILSSSSQKGKYPHNMPYKTIPQLHISANIP